ncbi:hypothetical protein SAMN04488107_3451 [Geodermatophilus saharensis]|uniref:Uncharacterized protein n=1 Tax=Geodermatophilus saharensis TaxID=1137994 RepID=A0A239GJD7_9ACTN|nr:hypothetical protein [Geodermatophilus saharensis]SNS69416.1 hypothetical protein SAMN04488107_3451 [Geodermatophilus saharensis]
MRCTSTIGVLAAVVVGVGATPALADGGPDGADDAGFVPVEEVIPDYYAPVSFQACDSTVTLESGDVREVEVRVTENPDGTTTTEFRGAWTVDLTRADGAVIDELDISGPGVEVSGPTGATITLGGPSLLFPIDEVQQAAWDAAGLPEGDLAYVKRGEVQVRVTVDAEGVPVSEEWVRLDARIIDLCRWFDRGNARDHDRGRAHAARGW